MVNPFTEPHGSKTVSGVTTPLGRSGMVVVVEVVSLGGVDGVVEPSPRVVVVSGARVFSGSPSFTDTTFCPPATHALASSDREMAVSESSRTT